MHFNQTLTCGRLIRRYKRFLADIELEDNEKITAHCPNSGSMKSCAIPGWPVLLSESAKKERRYRYTWEMVHNGICWIGINTGIPNRICAEAIEQGKISELSGYEKVHREKKYGKNSRIDLLLENAGTLCYVEIKNVTLVEHDGNYYFPDAVTERGRKHLYELRDMVTQGHRAVILYVIQRGDGEYFKPAKHIDPEYTRALEVCSSDGVEVLAYRAHVTPEKIEIADKVQWKRD